MAINYPTYALVGFGAAKPPQDLYFLVLVADKAGNEHEKRMILGGLQALQASLRGRPRKSCKLHDLKFAARNMM
jgi:hypothetical protein